MATPSLHDKKLTLKTRLILYNRGSIMLLKQVRPNGGDYTFVGGNIESSEFAKQALVREAFEEAGIVIHPDDLRLAHVLHKKDRTGQRIILYFKTAVWQGELRNREPHKFKEAAWFSLDALPKNLSGTARHVLKMYRKGEMYSEFLKRLK
jgi:8-oxo-dGTP pyrophosphatase MutT (NUDIX family)